MERMKDSEFLCSHPRVPMTGSEESSPLTSPPSVMKSQSTHDAASYEGTQPRTRHSKYFLEDVPVTFEVHKHFLERESSVFKAMFSCPPDSAGPEGATEDNPIILPGVKADEFAALLDYFYEPARGLNDALPSSWPTKRPIKKTKGKGTKGPSTTECLRSLLSIATRFDFERPRRFAIEALGQRLSEFTTVNRILLARVRNR
ncbi:hypothetical protein FA13DRAFT_1790379 [Coprinellus micaceus]|uniref:BTB domain-containing protein n=1 Tax=Coprinellus micaceus TaxID=71717 RepID=A0A4Y7TGG0_COPMI|nr:hypothetical protein FA13DRAFT_1790379 [Coprinellus micaceus]